MWKMSCPSTWQECKEEGTTAIQSNLEHYYPPPPPPPPEWDVGPLNKFPSSPERQCWTSVLSIETWQKCGRGGGGAVSTAGYKTWSINTTPEWNAGPPPPNICWYFQIYSDFCSTVSCVRALKEGSEQGLKLLGEGDNPVTTLVMPIKKYTPAPSPVFPKMIFVVFWPHCWTMIIR